MMMERSRGCRRGAGETEAADTRSVAVFHVPFLVEWLQDT